MEELSCRKRNPCYSWIRGYKWNPSLTMLCQLLHKVFTPILSDVTIIKLFTSYCWLRRSECRRLLREQHDSGDISYCSWGIGLQHIHHKRKCLSCLKCARNLHVRYITAVDSTLHYQGTRWTSSLSHLIPYMSEPIPSLSHSTPYLSELIPRLSHLILGLSESVLRLSHFIPSLSYSIPVLSESVPRLSHSIPRLSELNPWLSCSFPDQSDYIPNLSEKSTWKRNQFRANVTALKPH